MAKTIKSPVLEAIKNRYSCRRYRPDLPDVETLKLLEEAVRWAPSACNRQPYTFHFITGKRTIHDIAEAVPLGPASVNAWMKTAPIIVAAVGKPELVWHKMTQVIDTDYHRTDAIIAADHLSLVATDLGLGTCWVGWFHRKKVGKILGIPGSEEVVILMTLGHPASDPTSRKPRKGVEELIVKR